MASLRNLMMVFLFVAVIAILFLTFAMDREAKMFNYIIKSDEKKTVDLETKTPSPALLAKLNKHEKLVEVDTDPLPLSAKCSRPVFLAVVIASSPGGFNRRNSIRGTWASSYKIDKKTVNVDKGGGDMIKIVFLIGQTDDKDLMALVQTEAAMFGDIVLGQLQENYRNLTMKTRLGLKWAYYYCQAKYFLKTDDDVFINRTPLISWLEQQQRSKFYSGWCNFNSPVVRDPNNKWYISPEDYSGTNYPGYCLGGGYIMSNDVLGRILTLSYGRKLFPMEDLYVGLMVKDLHDVFPTDNKANFNLVFGGTQGCSYNRLFLAHPVDAKDQLKMFLQANLAQRTC